MAATEPIARGFVRQVRNALAHLYDYAYLQNHPLAALIDPTNDLDRVTRGQKLRRLLLDCIETLRPRAQDVAPSEAARAHFMLTFRYVDGMSTKEIAALRALGPRQTYREIERGVEAVARILHDRLQAAQRPAGSIGSADEEPAGDLLQTAQAEVARLQETARIESLDLREMLQGVLEMMRPIGERTGVQVAITSPGPWPSVLANRVMLRQALLNLLTHALDTAIRGDLAIGVNRAQAEVHVEFSESAGASRTSPLSPAVDEQSRVSLPVCEALLRAQGGRLETCVKNGRWQARMVLPTPGRMTILAVDDNQDLVTLLQRYLAGHELNVVGATDGEQALRLAAELQPSLITLDVMMPNEDGWEILHKLKAAPATSRIPVIVCSVLQAKDLAQSMGASGYLAKPVRQADLLKLLPHWLGPLRPAE